MVDAASKETYRRLAAWLESVAADEAPAQEALDWLAVHFRSRALPDSKLIDKLDEALGHYQMDDDIRAKDSEYAAGQRDTR